MSFLGPFFIALVVGGIFGCGVFAVSKIWRERNTTPDQANGAPEGARIFHFQHPDAQGSNLSVRVHSTSLRQLGGADATLQAAVPDTRKLTQGGMERIHDVREFHSRTSIKKSGIESHEYGNCK
jgi:hypothetical protein